MQEPRLIVLGNVPPANNDKWHQRNDVFSGNGIAPCETATQFKDASRVFVVDNMKDNQIYQVGSLVNQITSTRNNPSRERVYLSKGIAPALNTMQGGGRQPYIVTEKEIDDDMIYIKQATKDGYIPLENGGVADLSFPTSTTRRGRVQNNGTISPTLTTSPNLYVITEEDGYYEVAEDGSLTRKEPSIRKLTPTECFVLQGMTTEDCLKAREVGVSDSQLYKQAGNGLTTNCVQFLMEHLYKSLYDPSYITTDEKMYEKYKDGFEEVNEINADPHALNINGFATEENIEDAYEDEEDWEGLFS